MFSPLLAIEASPCLPAEASSTVLFFICITTLEREREGGKEGGREGEGGREREGGRKGGRRRREERGREGKEGREGGKIREGGRREKWGEESVEKKV